MTVNIEKMRKEMRYESRKFAVQLVVGFAAAVGAGVALANWVSSHNPAPTPVAPPAATAPATRG